MEAKTNLSIQPMPVSISAEVIENQQRANRVQMTQLAGEVSFLSILEDAEIRPALKPQASVALLEVLSTEDLQEQKATSAKSAPIDTPKTADEDSSNKSRRILPLAEVNEQELQDAADLWIVDLKQLNLNDIKIIQNLVQTSLVPMMTVLSSSEGSSSLSYKGFEISEGLRKMLEQAYKTQKPIRIDLSDNASIILRLQRNGRVSAEFVPNDKVTALFFEQNLSELRNRLESKQLPYGDLIVRQWKQEPDEEEKPR